VRVAIATSSFLLGGGISAYNQELCRALLEAGCEVLVASSELVDGRLTLDSGGSVCTVRVRVPESPGDDALAAKILFGQIVEFDPDILVSSANGYLSSLFPYFAERRVRISISHFYNGFLALVAARTPADTDWIVALSEAGRGFLLTLPGVADDEVQVVYNAVADDGRDVGLLIDEKSRQRRLSIVYPGGAAGHKAPDVVLQVVRLLAATDLEWQLTWLGEPAWLPGYVCRAARSRTVFTGSVPRTESQEHIRRAQCLLLPSRGEGCPMSLLEAMRSGTVPFVSSCPSAMRELVVEGICGFVAPVGGAMAIVSKMLYFSRSVQMRRELMWGARTVFEQKLRTEAWTSTMLGLMCRRRTTRAAGGDSDRLDTTIEFHWHDRRGSLLKPNLEFVKDRWAYIMHRCRCVLRRVR